MVGRSSIVTAAERIPRPLGAPGAVRGVTAAYGCAHYGKSLFWYTSEILFAFFLTEVGGLSGQGMGLVVGFGLLASVGFDLAFGWGLRKRLAEVRRAARLQLTGAVLSAAALGGFFLTPWIDGAQAKFAFALAAMLAFRCAYALYDLPQNVLLALATRSEQARTRVAAVRLFFSGLATLSVSLLVALVVADRDAASRAVVLLWSAAAIASLSVGAAWRLQRCLSKDSAAAGALGATPVDLSQTGTASPSPLAPQPLLLTATFVVSLTVSMFSKLEPYLAAYVLASPLWGGAMITAAALGTTVSQVAWAGLSDRWSRPVVFSLAAGLLIIAALVFLAGIAVSPWIALAAALVFGAASGGLSSLMWAAFGDAVADRSPTASGLAFATFTGVSKLALALSSLLLGLFLHVVDYRDAESGSILAAMTLWPALGGAACLVLAALWRRHRASAPLEPAPAAWRVSGDTIISPRLR